MTKMNNKANKNNAATKKRTKGQRRARTVALRIAEPRLRGPRMDALKTTEHLHANSPATTPRPSQFYEMMLTWSPWIFMLRQQALLARGFASMIEAQQKFAQLWSLPSHRASQGGQR